MLKLFRVPRSLSLGMLPNRALASKAEHHVTKGEPRSLNLERSVSKPARAVLRRAAKLNIGLRTLCPPAVERLTERLKPPGREGLAASYLPLSLRNAAYQPTATSKAVLAELGRRAREEGARDDERRVLLSLVATEVNENIPAMKVVTFLDFLGTALFSCVGTQLAGEAGMHVVGAALVGCAAAMGGGTLNNVLHGDTRGGVFWVRDPRYLAVAAGASVLTFYLWPKFEVASARAEMAAMGATGDEVDLAGFESALEADASFASRARHALTPSIAKDWCADNYGPDGELTAAAMFRWLDKDNSGTLHRDELVRLVRLEANESLLLYTMDSVALAALGVISSQNALRRGLHPAVAVAAGVSICFGGVLRDLLCRRDVALGSSSFALGVFGGAAAFVASTELSLKLRPSALPLGWRIGLGLGTCIGIRALAWRYRDEGDLLPPMANYVRQ